VELKGDFTFLRMLIRILTFSSLGPRLGQRTL
jgi:hypothetical protein